MDDDEWWATLPAERKRSIRRWLDPTDPDHARREAMTHPDQLALLPAEEEAPGWR